MKHSLNPHPSTLILLILSVLSVVSCSTPRMATQVVHEVSHDTLYLSNIQYDSVYVFQDHLTDRSRDTIYIRDVQYEYKYKLIRDTVYRTQIDTIPVIREVEIVKTEKYVPSIYKWSLGVCIGLIAIFIIRLILKIYFRK